MSLDHEEGPELSGDPMSALTKMFANLTGELKPRLVKLVKIGEIPRPEMRVFSSVEEATAAAKDGSKPQLVRCAPTRIVKPATYFHDMEDHPEGTLVYTSGFGNVLAILVQESIEQIQASAGLHIE